MRVVQHCPGPGMQYSHQSRLGAQPLWIGAEFLNACGRSIEQEPVQELLMGAGQRAQLRRQRESQQKIGTRQQAATLLFQPSLGLLAMALGTVPVPARVITVLQPATVRAAIDLSTQCRRAALLDGLQRPFLAGQNTQSGAKLRSGGPDNVRYLQHRKPPGALMDLEVPCQNLQRMD